MKNPLSFLLAPLLLSVPCCAQTPPRAVYDLDIRLDLEAQTTVGHMQVRLPSGTQVARLNLAAGNGRSMVLRRVEVDGTAQRLPASDIAGIVEVPLDGADGLRVDYEAPLDGRLKQPFGYYLLGPLGARRFAYPELVDASGRALEADFSVHLDHPSELTVYTTGGRGTSHTEGGRTVAEYRAERVRGFAIVGGEGFRIQRRMSGGVPVEAFYHPDYEDRFLLAVESAGEAAAWYRETYGFFPLEHVGIIQGHPRYSGGYPLPNMFAVHLGNLEDDHLAFITAHELGHYYWGFTVLAPRETAGPNDLDWLTLGLGIWGDQLYLAERKGITLDEQFRRDRSQGSWIVGYLEALAADHDQTMRLSPAEQATLGFDYNSLIRHGKAATGLYLESMILGPDSFLELQRQILREYEGRPLHAAEFVEILERSGSPDAGAFFDAWYHDDATVDVVIDGVEPDPSGGWRVLLRRTGSVPYPVTVAVETDAGERRHVFGADASHDTLRSREPPTRVVIDPDGIVPLPNAHNLEMRSALAIALDRARRDEQFIVVAGALLAEAPDDHFIRHRLARRLYSSARYEEVVELWPSDSEECDTADLCRVGYYAARSLARRGRTEAAVALMERLADDAEQVGLGDVWQNLRRDLSALRRG